MPTKGATGLESRLARLAANQHGVVSTAQLRKLGLGPGAINNRAGTGRLFAVHRGVYAVGHSGLSLEGLWMAGVLAVGGDAVLSHRSAAGLWRLLPWSPGAVEVTVPGHGGRKPRAGIRIRRSRTLLPSPGTGSPTTRRRNIPVTTPARTLSDLRRCVSPQHLAKASRRAEVLGLQVEDASPVSAAPHAELERVFLSLCRRHRLPEPEVNVAVGRHLPDFLWREARLVVETDGWRFHRGRANFEHDRRRAAALATAGYEVMRFTWRQVKEEPCEVADAVRARLGARASSPGSVRPA